MGQYIDYNLYDLMDIRTGMILSNENTSGIRISAFMNSIDFGQIIGANTSICQATNYHSEKLKNKQVLAVMNIKPNPKLIGNYVCELLILGIPTKDCTSLVVPDKVAILGGKLFKEVKRL